MKKQVLIIMPSMFIGGAERSLLGFLESVDYSKYDVSLFLYRHEGEFLQYIPENVNLLPEVEAYRTFDVPIKSLLLSKNFMFGLARIFSKIALKMHCMLSGEKAGVWMSMQYTAKYLQIFLPKIPGNYDIGIMYLGIADTLINKVNATKKVAWNHTDYDTLFPNKKMDIKTYSRIDYLISVSDSCTKKYIKYYPQFTDKAKTIENSLAINTIKTQTLERVNDFNVDGEELKLLSIGRFCYAKNFDNIPDICARLIDKGLNVKWFIIGYGGDEQLIKDRIAELHMQEHVILLGKKENPYPYIEACDLYVQPSRYEGKCVTVREAQVLCKPVVITAYDTSSSQLENGVDGLIVPMDNERCANAIMNLMKDSSKIQQLSRMCSERDYSNSSEVEKFFGILMNG